jgi:hypothetical protein
MKLRLTLHGAMPKSSGVDKYEDITVITAIGKSQNERVGFRLIKFPFLQPHRDHKLWHGLSVAATTFGK